MLHDATDTQPPESNQTQTKTEYKHTATRVQPETNPTATTFNDDVTALDDSSPPWLDGSRRVIPRVTPAHTVCPNPQLVVTQPTRAMSAASHTQVLHPQLRYTQSHPRCTRIRDCTPPCRSPQVLEPSVEHHVEVTHLSMIPTKVTAWYAPVFRRVVRAGNTPRPVGIHGVPVA